MGFVDRAFQKLQAKTVKTKRTIQKNDNNPGDSTTTTSGSAATDVAANTISSSVSSWLRSSLTLDDAMHYQSDATRWEKAVVAMDSIVAQVTKFDPDGVDVVCVGGMELSRKKESSMASSKRTSKKSNNGGGRIEWCRNSWNTQGLEDKVTPMYPGGSCPLGQAMNQVLTEVLQKNLAVTPCSVLVLTAGKPDDPELLEEALRVAAQKVADNFGASSSSSLPLSVTFLQIGNDQSASSYLRYLDFKMFGIRRETGKKVDIVDTMSYYEIRETMDRMKEHSKRIEKRWQRRDRNRAILEAIAGAEGVRRLSLQSQRYANNNNNNNIGAATTAVIYKKFFQKINREDRCDYIIVVDRSAKMTVVDGMEYNT